MEERADVVVVGAGLAGRFAALALASQGFEVLVCDRAMGADPCEDPRTTALGYASVRAMKRLGVWDQMTRDAAPVRNIQVAMARGGGALRPADKGAVLSFDDGLLGDTERWNATALAHIVPNGALRRALGAACEAESGITFRQGAVASITPNQGGVRVRFDDGTDLAARLVVGCDGRRSPLRRRAGIRTIERDFGQDALTVTARHARPHDGVARQVFLPGGPMAALPLTGDRSSLVWSVPRKTADAYAAEPARIGDAAAAHFAELGDISLEGSPARFALGLVYASTLIADRLALVGEAGRAIHPIAGQGYNLAVADACALADTLADARAVGLDIGHGTVLSGYDEWRRPDAAMMAFGTTALSQGLGTTERVTRGLAGLGFGLVQRSEGLRRAFAARAGGEAGRTPRLMTAEA